MEDLFFRDIEKYVYDECTKEEMKLFKKHMETCAKCREEYELSCSVKNAMNSMNTIVPPADFSKLVNERLDRELAAPKKPRMLKAGYRKYSAVAACLVLAAVFGTQNTEVSKPVIETTTFTDQSLQPVPDNAESQPAEAQPVAPTATNAPVVTVPTIVNKVSAPVVETPAFIDKVLTHMDKAPILVDKIPVGVVETPVVSVKAPADSVVETPVVSVEAPADSVVETPPSATMVPESTASTVITPVATPAVTVTTPAATENPQPQPVKDDDVLSKIPPHLNPKNQVVLASSVEKTYEISGVSPEEVPRKERDLAAEFALLDTTNSGDIVANAATIARMQGVQFKITHDSDPKDYGIGSGSLFISSSDKDIIDELLPKYMTVTDDSCYFFTHDNYNLFMQEMDDYGVTYQERAVAQDGGNVAFKIILS